MATPPPAPQHAGWLLKRGHFNTDFKRRWFTLTEGVTMSYYETPEAASRGKLKGEVHVTAVGHCDTRHLSGIDHAGDVARVFRFDTAERKSFVVSADTVEEKLGWLQALLFSLGSLPQNVPCETVLRLSSGGGAGAAAGAGVVWPLLASAAAQERAGNRPAARRALEEALAASGYAPNTGAYSAGRLCALYELGRLLCCDARYTAALQRFNAALHMAPAAQRQQLLIQCAWCSWQIQRSAEAEALYTAVLDADPLCWAALLDRARMEMECGAWAAALSDLDLVVAMRPPPKPPQVEVPEDAANAAIPNDTRGTGVMPTNCDPASAATAAASAANTGSRSSTSGASSLGSFFTAGSLEPRPGVSCSEARASAPASVGATPPQPPPVSSSTSAPEMPTHATPALAGGYEVTKRKQCTQRGRRPEGGDHHTAHGSLLC